MLCIDFQQRKILTSSFMFLLLKTHSYKSSFYDNVIQSQWQRSNTIQRKKSLKRKFSLKIVIFLSVFCFFELIFINNIENISLIVSIHCILLEYETRAH